MLENTKESWASKTATRDCKKEKLENKMVKLENKTEMSENTTVMWENRKETWDCRKGMWESRKAKSGNTMEMLVNNLDLLASIQLMVNLESIQERSASRTGSPATGKASLA